MLTLFRRAMTSSADRGPVVYQAIMKALTEGLQPSEIELVDDSKSHAGHAAMQGKAGGGTHFKVKIISDKFEGLNSVRRHQLVYSLLDAHFKEGLHALNIVAKTPAEVKK